MPLVVHLESWFRFSCLTLFCITFADLGYDYSNATYRELYVIA